MSDFRKLLIVSVGAISLVAVTNVAAQEVEDPPVAPSSYDQLSEGGKKMVDAFMGGQTPPSTTVIDETTGAESTTTAPELTADQVADMKAETGWGNVFKQLKAEGYYDDYRNLGELRSSSVRPDHSFDRPERGGGKPDVPPGKPF